MAAFDCQKAYFLLLTYPPAEMHKVLSAHMWRLAILQVRFWSMCFTYYILKSTHLYIPCIIFFFFCFFYLKVRFFQRDRQEVFLPELYSIPFSLVPFILPHFSLVLHPSFLNYTAGIQYSTSKTAYLVAMLSSSTFCTQLSALTKDNQPQKRSPAYKVTLIPRSNIK